MTRISTLAPFQNPFFLALWTATLASNFGLQIHLMAASWLMVSLASQPLMVAMVQVAVAVPFIMFALFAGALGDIYDRRLIMLCAQLFAFLSSALLAIFALTELITPWVLLLLVLLISLGAAFFTPVWAASVGSTVPRKHLADAISLNVSNFNLARCLSPALGGLLITSIGVAWAFVVNTLSYVGTITVLWRWKPPPQVQQSPPEPILWAMTMGIRYALRTHYIRVFIVRLVLCGIGGAVHLTLMPLVASDHLDGTASTFAVLLTAFGIGAVTGSLTVNWLRSVLGVQKSTLCCQLTLALSTLLLGTTDNLIACAALIAIGGGAWMTFLTLMNAGVQLLSPDWIVGRLLAVFQTSIFIAMALGGLIWGKVAGELGIASALSLASVAIILSSIYGWLRPAHDSDSINIENANLPSMTPEHTRTDPGSSPIIATVIYQVDNTNESAFLSAMEELKWVRLRLGALDWSLQQGLEDPELWVERYTSRDWDDHKRRVGRYTQHDNDIRLRAAAYDRRGKPEMYRSVKREPLGKIPQRPGTPDNLIIQ